MFKKPYTLRRYGVQTAADGYAAFDYTDQTVRLNVQPLSAQELQALPEGDRASRRVKAFGAFPVRTVDQRAGLPADRLFYRGRWYECESAGTWDHTPLAHMESQWAAVPENQREDPPREGDAPDDSPGTENESA